MAQALARMTVQVPDADNATYWRLTKEESRDKECHAKSSRLTKKKTGPVMSKHTP
jgi:hypothetical protein